MLCRTRKPLLTIGTQARHRKRCCKRSDQFPKGAARVSDSSGYPPSAVVDIDGSDLVDLERSGLAG